MNVLMGVKLISVKAMDVQEVADVIQIVQIVVFTCVILDVVRVECVVSCNYTCWGGCSGKKKEDQKVLLST